MSLFNLLFLLIFTAPSLSYSQSCRSFLQKTDYSTYKLSITKVRPASKISDNFHSSDLMNRLNDLGAIVLKQSIPSARTQCYGTCYIYAGIGLLESELINAGLIEPGDLLLAPSILIETAKIRLAAGIPASNLGQLLHGGWFEIFHSTHGKKLYVLPKEEVKKIGKVKHHSNYVLFLENNFLETTLGDTGSDFQDFLLTNTGLSFTDLFMNYLNEYTLKKDTPLPKLKHLGPLSFNYTFHDLYKSLDTPIVVDTDRKSEIKPLFKDTSFDDDSLMTISQKILENKSVYVSLNKNLFGGAHTVLLTNIVVNHDSKSITGFLMLNSWGIDQPLFGYSYISVAELKKYMTTFMYLNEIRQN